MALRLEESLCGYIHSNLKSSSYSIIQSSSSQGTALPLLSSSRYISSYSSLRLASLAAAHALSERPTVYPEVLEAFASLSRFTISCLLRSLMSLFSLSSFILSCIVSSRQ